MNTFKLDGPGGISGLKQHPSAISMDTTAPWTFPGNVTINGTLTTVGTGMEGAQTISSANAHALAVGANGTTNPVFNVDSSATSVATGINVVGAAAGSGVAVSVLSSGSNENVTIDAKGSGTIALNGTGTGVVTVGHGLTVSGAVTMTSTSATAIAAGANGGTNPGFLLDNSVGSASTGLWVQPQAAGGGVVLATLSSGSNENMKLQAKGTGNINLAANTATPAAGSAQAAVLLGTTAGFGIYFGSGAPTVSAAQGSIYIRSDGSSTSTRMYINTTGSTTWTNVTTAA